MTKFDILNEAIKEYIDENEVSDISELCLIDNLTNLILNIPISKYNLKYKSKVPLKKNLNYTLDFLLTINPSFQDYFIERIDDKSFVFAHNTLDTAHSAYDLENKKRVIFIPVKNTLEDSFAMVHELMHDMNMDEEDFEYENNTRYFFTEALSTLIELLLEDYFVEKKVKDARIDVNDILKCTRIKAAITDFNLRLINNYLEQGFVDKGVFYNILGLYDEEEIVYITYAFDEIIENHCLTIEYEQQYVLGSLIATYMYNRINQDKKNIQELIDLNMMIQKCDFAQVLDYLELEHDDIDLTPKSYELLQNNYKKYIKSR